MEDIIFKKEGDILVCRKNYRNIFKKGNEYKVKHSYYSSPSLLYPNGIIKNTTVILSENGGQFYFFTDKELSKVDKDYYVYLYDYFYTKEEIRRLKLEKINEI